LGVTYGLTRKLGKEGICILTELNKDLGKKTEKTAGGRRNCLRLEQAGVGELGRKKETSEEEDDVLKKIETDDPGVGWI